MPPVSTMRSLHASPVGLAVEAVAGDAGLVADDGAARTDEPVKERGLADVGAADDGDSDGGAAANFSFDDHS